MCSRKNLEAETVAATGLMHVHFNHILMLHSVLSRADPRLFVVLPTLSAFASHLG